MAKQKRPPEAPVPGVPPSDAPESASEALLPVVQKKDAVRSGSTFLARRVPTTIEEIEFIGRNAASSGLYKDVKTMPQAIMKIVTGIELGVPASVALTKIWFIEGRLTAAAEILGAVVKRTGEFWFETLRLDYERCEIGFWRSLGPATEEEIRSFRKMTTYTEAVQNRQNLVLNGKHYGFVYLSVFRKEDGVAAGKVGTEKANWDRYLRNMLYARCLSNGARWNCQHLINGMYVPEDFDLETTDSGEMVWTDDALRKASKNVRLEWHLEAVTALKPHLKGPMLDTLRLKWNDATTDNDAFTVMLERTAEQLGIRLPPRPVEAEQV